MRIWAARWARRWVSGSANVDTTLAGAFIVDPATGREDPNDRIFVLTEFLGELHPSGDVTASLTINGRSWPYTEPLVLPFGQVATWRVINASATTHPMHLHGTFYTVESLGTYATDTIYDHDSRRLVTTEALAPGTTMTMRWVPDRWGNGCSTATCRVTSRGDMRTPDMSPAERQAMAHGRTTSSIRWRDWCSASRSCLATKRRRRISSSRRPAT
jgi:hypothetical protein